MGDVKGKEKSEKSGFGTKGGSNHMFSKSHAGAQEPGQTTAGGHSKAGKLTGGSGHMSGQNHAGAQEPGQTTAGGAKKSGGFSVEGGKGHMFGKTGAASARPA